VGIVWLLGRGAVSGLLIALSFPPFDFTFVAFVALLPLLWALDDLAAANARRPLVTFAGSAFAAGWMAGLVYFVALLWWIILLDAPALTIPWVRYPGTFAITAFLALYIGLFGIAYAWVRARTQLSPVLIAPALFTVAEVARSYWELGFPWGHFGYSQVEFLPALQMASVVGVHGITAWIVVVNALLYGIVRRRPPAPGVIAAAVLVLGVPIALGAYRLARSGEPPRLRVALVQPNIPNDKKWDPRLRPEHFENLAQLSRQGKDAGAELVVWPETAAPCFLLRDRRWRPFVESLAAELEIPVFLGLPDYERVSRDRVTYTNSAALFGADGGFAGRMDKIELVPFGERVPFSQYLSVLDRVDFGEADFVAGREFVLFEAGDFRFANLVCFEAIFPYLTRRYALEGADLLVNITNDSWFGAGSGAEQHAEMAVVRCVETGSGMARCANSGISMGIDPWGRRFGVTPLFTRELSVVDVPVREGATLYTRWGDWVPGIAFVASSALLVVAFVRRRD
jgi:apolipoprotein N-acyltransferase